MPKKAKINGVAYTSRREAEARIAGLNNAVRQTDPVVMPHVEAYLSGLLQAPPMNPDELIPLVNALTPAEEAFMLRMCGAHCTCFNDILTKRREWVTEIRQIEELIATLPNDEPEPVVPSDTVSVLRNPFAEMQEANELGFDGLDSWDLNTDGVGV